MPLISPTESVEAQIKTIDGLTEAHNGAFLNLTGEEWKA